MSKATGIMSQIRAESLLHGSDILTQISDLRSSLTMPSEGSRLNFDDYFLWLQRQIEAIPRIELLSVMPRRQESNYNIQLIEALDQVQERATVAYSKVLAFQTRLIEIDEAMKNISATFEAWYLLALEEHLTDIGLKLPLTNKKALASSEFNRLMGNAPVVLRSLQVAVKAEIAHLEGKKKMAREKFELGREQVNMSWMNQIPGNTGVSGDPGSLRLLREPVDEEEEEEAETEVPTFISKRQRIAPFEPSADTEAAPSAYSTDSEETTGQCSVCGERQWLSPGGATCDNGHGGALDVSVAGEAATSASTSCPEASDGGDAEEIPSEAVAPTPAAAREEPGEAPSPDGAPAAEPREEGADELPSSPASTGEDDGGEGCTVEAGTSVISEIQSIDADQAVEAATEAISRLTAEGEAIPMGFFKTGTPQEAVQVTFAQADEAFSSDDADQDTDEHDIAEQVQNVADDAEEEIEVFASSSRTVAAPVSMPDIAPEDELEHLLLKRQPSPAAPTPVPEERTAAPAPSPAPAPRKRLAFRYEDD